MSSSTIACDTCDSEDKWGYPKHHHGLQRRDTVCVFVTQRYDRACISVSGV